MTDIGPRPPAPGKTGETGKSSLQRLTELAREQAAAPAPAAVQRSGRAEVIAAADELRAHAAPRRVRRTFLTFGSVACVAALVLGLVWLQRDQPLTYRIQGGQSSEHGYLAAISGSDTAVSFSDGSQIAAAPGARLRIESTRIDGARVALERGVATAKVTHRKHTSWLFVAGPFEVHVTGTRFTLRWDDDQQAIDLTLHEGSVEVRSPLGSSSCVVRQGQRFRASLRAGTMQLENSDAQPVAKSPPDAAAAAVTTVTTQPAGAVVNAASRRQAAAHDAGHSTERWSRWVQRGSFQAVVDAANVRGLEQTLRTSDAQDLRALADAARYLNQFELAERSLTTLRTRFAGRKPALAATFLLGRTYEANNRHADADREYVRYWSAAASQRPAEFAADALAGHMRCVAEVSGAAAARPIAEQYLRRYPEGVHAKLARSYVSTQ